MANGDKLMTETTWNIRESFSVLTPPATDSASPLLLLTIGRKHAANVSGKVSSQVVQSTPVPASRQPRCCL